MSDASQTPSPATQTALEILGVAEETKNSVSKPPVTGQSEPAATTPQASQPQQPETPTTPTAAPSVDIRDKPTRENYTALVEGFREQLRAEGKTNSTQSNYSIAASAFLEEIIARGLSWSEVPPDIPAAVYAKARANWTSPARANTWSSALRVFEKYLPLVGITNLPKLSYPPHVGRTKKGYTQQGKVIEPLPSYQAAQHGQVLQEKVINVPHTPDPAQSWASLVDPPSSVGNGVRKTTQKITTGRPTARKLIMDFLPQDGLLRVFYRSDGSDGSSPGADVLVGQYEAQTLDGYIDLSGFIQDRIHPTQARKLRAPVVTYKVNAYDERQQLISSREVSLANSQGRTGELSETELLVKKLEEMQRKAEEMQRKAEEEARLAREELKKGNPDHMQLVLAMLEQGKANSSVEEIKSLKEELRHVAEKPKDESATQLAQIMSEVQRSQAEMMRVMMEQSKAEQQQNLNLIMEMIRSQASKPQEDPLIKATQMLSFMKQMQPEKPAVDPVVEMMKLQLEQMREENREMKRSQAENGGLGGILTQVKALREASEFFGGGAPSAFDSLLEALPDAMKAFAQMQANHSNLAAIKNAGQQQAQPQPTQQQPQAANQNGNPPNAQTQMQPFPKDAELGMRTIIEGAQTEDVNLVRQGAINMLGAMAQGGYPWATYVSIARQRLNAAETADEVEELVKWLLTQIGAAQLDAQYDLTNVITSALVEAWTDLTTVLFGEARTLQGVPDQTDEHSSADGEHSSSTTEHSSSARRSQFSSETLDELETLDDEIVSAREVAERVKAAQALEVTSKKTVEPANVNVDVDVKPSDVSVKPASVSVKPTNINVEPADVEGQAAEGQAAELADSKEIIENATVDHKTETNGILAPVTGQAAQIVSASDDGE